MAQALAPATFWFIPFLSTSVMKMQQLLIIHVALPGVEDRRTSQLTLARTDWTRKLSASQQIRVN